MFALLLVEIETDPDWQTVDVDPNLEVMSIRADPDPQQRLGLYFKVCISRICVWIVPYHSKPRREPESL